MKKPKVVFVSESIRRDSHVPLRYLKKFQVVHLFLKAPYGDMDKKDFAGSRQVELKNMLKEIIAEKPDIIQGVEPFGSRLSLKLSYICLKAKRKTKAKLVVPVLENRPIEERFSAFQRAVLRLFCPVYFREADRVVALNRGAVQDIRRYFKKAKIVKGIIWGVWGVDLNLFKPSGDKEKGLIVYVGRIVFEKGLKYLLEGFKIASSKIPFIHLDLIGQGDFERELRQFVLENKLQDKVNFVGVVKNKDVPRYLARAELCVYPSITTKKWEEQVGTVNFQALSCGTPVLTTRSGAIPEYIKDGEAAILVKEKSARDIAKALIKFFSDARLAKKLTSQARETAKKYDIKKEIAKAEKLFIEVLNES